jgi:hypothetical protein
MGGAGGAPPQPLIARTNNAAGTCRALNFSLPGLHMTILLQQGSQPAIGGSIRNVL